MVTDRLFDQPEINTEELLRYVKEMGIQPIRVPIQEQPLAALGGPINTNPIWVEGNDPFRWEMPFESFKMMIIDFSEPDERLLLLC